jgi:hypothetical protein
LPDADKIQAVEMDDFDAQGFKEKTREYQKISEIEAGSIFYGG